MFFRNAQPERYKDGKLASPSKQLTAGCFAMSVERFWFSHMHECSEEDVYFEVCQRFLPRGAGIFPQWLTVKFFAFLPAARVSLYAPVQACRVKFEVSRALSVPIRSISRMVMTMFRTFLCLSSNIVWQASLLQYIVLSDICFLVTTKDVSTEKGHC